MSHLVHLQIFLNNSFKNNIYTMWNVQNNEKMEMNEGDNIMMHEDDEVYFIDIYILKIQGSIYTTYITTFCCRDMFL